MENIYTDTDSPIDKERLIDILTDKLPVLRAEIGISQDKLGEILEYSRQTLWSVEKKRRRMQWSMFMSVLMFFAQNEKTAPLLETTGAYRLELQKILAYNSRQ